MVQEVLGHETTVGEAISQLAGAQRIFEGYKIDCCCGSRATLAQAARKAGVEVDELIAALKNGTVEEKPAENKDWSKESLTELADHIVEFHHGYLKENLPEIGALAEKVARVHGGHTPELVKLKDVFLAMKDELEAHMMKEEAVLFPMIRDMEASGQREFHCGSLENPIRVMMMEHDSAEDALSEMSLLTNRFTPPLDACSSYRRLFGALEQLSKDMETHINKEDKILFPRAVEKEAS